MRIQPWGAPEPHPELDERTSCAPELLVSVVFVLPEFAGTPSTDSKRGYVYKWAAGLPPRMGMRVWAPVHNYREHYAVVIGVNVPLPDRFTLEELSTIHRLA